jgi:hypothetical protein
MEEQIFTWVKTLTWPAVSEWVRSRVSKVSTTGASLDDIHASVKLIGSNHLHSLPEMAETLKRIETSLSKLDDIKTGIEVIKSKIK